MKTKTEIKPYKDLDDATCGVAKTIKIIGSKWTMLILRDLFEGKKRFGELRRSLTGISTKTLTVRLQELERDKLIKRKVYPVVPMKVEYSLTPRGESLKNIIDDMRAWGDSH